MNIFDQVNSLQTDLMEANLKLREQAHELVRLRSWAKAVGKADQEICDALDRYRDEAERLRAEAERLRRLEAAVLEYGDVIESEVCAFTPDDSLKTAIAESRAAKEGDRG